MLLELAGPVLAEARWRRGGARPPAAHLTAHDAVTVPTAAQAERVERRNETGLGVVVRLERFVGELLQVGGYPVGRRVRPTEAELAPQIAGQQVARHVAVLVGQLAGHDGGIEGSPVVPVHITAQTSPV